MTNVRPYLNIYVGDKIQLLIILKYIKINLSTSGYMKLSFFTTCKLAKLHSFDNNMRYVIKKTNVFLHLYDFNQKHVFVLL